MEPFVEFLLVVLFSLAMPQTYLSLLICTPILLLVVLKPLHTNKRSRAIIRSVFYASIGNILCCFIVTIVIIALPEIFSGQGNYIGLRWVLFMGPMLSVSLLFFIPLLIIIRKEDFKQLPKEDNGAVKAAITAILFEALSVGVSVLPLWFIVQVL